MRTGHTLNLQDMLKVKAVRLDTFNKKEMESIQICAGLYGHKSAKPAIEHIINEYAELMRERDFYRTKVNELENLISRINSAYKAEIAGKNELFNLLNTKSDEPRKTK